jgi:small conductance mechanosensitive channel
MVIEFFVAYSFLIIGAVIIFIIGFLLARKVSNAVFKLCQNKGLDITLSKFLASVSRVVLVSIITIIALSKMGITIAPLVAAIGAISLGAGLAVQGLLSNYSAGLNIIITRPFVVGDTIAVQGVAGVVDEVKLAHTVLIDEDNVRITIPNKHIVGEIIKNSNNDTLVELSIGVSYQSNIDQTIAIIEQALDELKLPENTRKPLVGVAEFADSAITIGIRLWAPTVQAHDIGFQANKLIFAALSKAQVVIPFPQREVRMLSDNN